MKLFEIEQKGTNKCNWLTNFVTEGQKHLAGPWDHDADLLTLAEELRWDGGPSGHPSDGASASDFLSK
jgi:hypothetical protein